MTTHVRRRSLILAAGLALSLAPLALAPAALAQERTALKVGVTAGPHAEIIEQVKPLAAEKGLDLEIIEFTDYITPNAALDAGDLDVNVYQNQPFLDQQIADRGYKIVNVGLTVNFPMGIYSKKYKSWAEVPDGGKIAIQNDPTNGGRTLLLLQDKGVVKLKDGVGFKPTVFDIVENPKNLEFIEVEAAQTIRALDDVDAAAVNTNFALKGGLNPVTDALLQEAAKSPYINFIAVREQDKDKPWVKTLVSTYQSDAIKSFVQEHFKGAVLVGW